MTQSSLTTLIEKKGDGSPPADIIIAAIVLGGVAMFSFFIGLLVQFTGPVVEDGISPQLIGSLPYLGFGIYLLAVSISIYQRRPIGWYAGFLLALFALIASISSGVNLTATDLLMAGAPAGLLGYLLIRRDNFLN